MTSGAGRTITWTSYNMPSQITSGSNTDIYQYSPEHQRTRETHQDGTYLLFFGLGSGEPHFELQVGSNGVYNYRYYLDVSSGAAGMVIQNQTGGLSTNYFHRDHLGSVTAVTNDSGTVLQKFSYDAWGKRRNPNGTDATGPIASVVDRGFTDHEELDSVALINMNGRVYDPAIARFISADILIPRTSASQSFNRYSYIENNPLSGTDPSGHEDIVTNNNTDSGGGGGFAVVVMSDGTVFACGATCAEAPNLEGIAPGLPNPSPDANAPGAAGYGVSITYSNGITASSAVNPSAESSAWFDTFTANSAGKWNLSSSGVLLPTAFNVTSSLAYDAPVAGLANTVSDAQAYSMASPAAPTDPAQLAADQLENITVTAKSVKDAVVNSVTQDVSDVIGSIAGAAKGFGYYINSLAVSKNGMGSMLSKATLDIVKVNKTGDAVGVATTAVTGISYVNNLCTGNPREAAEDAGALGMGAAGSAIGIGGGFILAGPGGSAFFGVVGGWAGVQAGKLAGGGWYDLSVLLTQ